MVARVNLLQTVHKWPYSRRVEFTVFCLVSLIDRVHCICFNTWVKNTCDWVSAFLPWDDFVLVCQILVYALLG